MHKYLEGSVKMSLERELNVPERADCECSGRCGLLREDCDNAGTAVTVGTCADRS